MSINGVGGSNGVPYAYRAPGVSRTAETGKPAAPKSAATSASVGSAAPAGSDPALWSILTTEEREFFSRQAAMGPLAYGPDASARRTLAADMPLGQRIDARA